MGTDGSPHGRLAEAAALATRVVLLRNGQVIANGPPQLLLRSLDRAIRIDIRLAAPIAPDRLNGIPGVEGVSEETDGGGAPFLRVLGRADSDGGTSAFLARVVTEVVEQGGRIGGLEVGAPSLGDLFLRSPGEEP